MNGIEDLGVRSIYFLLARKVLMTPHIAEGNSRANATKNYQALYYLHFRTYFSPKHQLKSVFSLKNYGEEKEKKSWELFGIFLLNGRANWADLAASEAAMLPLTKILLKRVLLSLKLHSA